MIDRVLTGNSLLAAGFADPLTDDRSPDLVVKFHEGYLVGTDKRAEHGGFSDDDTHVALVLAGGGIPDALQGAVVDQGVAQQQIAVTMLDALGLDPTQLQGAVIDHTVALPMTVPEPATWALLASGGMILLAARRRAARSGNAPPLALSADSGGG